MDNGIGIYIHIPFCKSKCYYCDFNSYSGREHLAGSYFDALISEMKNSAASLSERPVKSIFIGGGTPSLVNSKYIASLLEVCSKYFKIEPDAEISMESNPGTLSYESLKAHKAAGVNRLSVGLQAWQDRLLESLGRIHRRRQYVENMEAAFRAGFRNINTDLIFGLPGQTFDDWVETLEAVTAIGCSGRDPGTTLDSGLTHLSCYSLKIEEGTDFGDRLEAGTLIPADDELDRKMYHYTVQYLARKGFRHYEISNFARPGYECRHNLIYWKAQEYAGFGAGAHSYLNHKRYNNVCGIEEYIETVKKTPASGRPDAWNDPAAGTLHENIEHIGRKEAMSEFMILGMRLVDGVRSCEFEERFGVSIREMYGDKLERLVKQGLLIKDRDCSERYRLTTLGLDLANKVFVEFI
ncbi:MAG: radical SAM family heme chaperone HemW [Clostridiaceae bacterium]